MLRVTRDTKVHATAKRKIAPAATSYQAISLRRRSQMKERTSVFLINLNLNFTTNVRYLSDNSSREGRVDRRVKKKLRLAGSKEIKKKKGKK